MLLYPTVNRGLTITYALSLLDQELISYQLLILLFLFLVRRLLLKNLGLRHFKLDRDEIWQECYSSK